MDAAPDDDVPRVLCASCGDVVGVYEPMIVVSGSGDVIKTSLARHSELVPSDEVHHSECFPG